MRYPAIKRSALLLMSLLSFPATQTVAELPPSSSETITGQLSTTRGFNWRYSFDIRQTHQSVILTVNLNLVPSHGITMVELEKAKKSWKEGIENFWSNRYALQIPGKKTMPILVKVFFHGPIFHHDVIIRPGKGFSDELNWHLKNNAELIAHEFGHMLGIYDEYQRGALDPENPIIDKTSIMTNSPSEGTTYPRHYQRVLDWFKTNNDFEQVQLVRLKQTPPETTQ